MQSQLAISIACYTLKSDRKMRQKPTSMWFLTLQLFVPMLVLHTSAAVYYVKPANSSFFNCPDHPCLTLEEYMENERAYFTTGSTFVFLAGNHVAPLPIGLTSVSEITLKGENTATERKPTILCWNRIFLLCENVRNLDIEGLQFLLDIRRVSGTIVALKISRSTGVLINCTIFKRNGLSESVARAIYTTQSTLTILSSVFEGNRGDDGGAIYAVAGSNLIIRATNFTSNRAEKGGGAIFSQGCVVTLSNAFLSNNTATKGGAMFSEDSVLTLNNNQGVR